MARHRRNGAVPGGRKPWIARVVDAFGALFRVVREFVVELVGELALYGLACGVVAGAALGFAFYPRETVPVLCGVAALAAYAAYLLIRSDRRGTPVPRGWLTAVAFAALALVVLVISYGVPGCACLP